MKRSNTYYSDAQKLYVTGIPHMEINLFPQGDQNKCQGTQTKSQSGQ